MYRGAYNEESNFQIKFVQLSAKKSYTDMKKRLADVITGLAQKNSDDPEQEEMPITKPEQIRMWMAEDKTRLLESFASVAQSEQRMEIDNSAEDPAAATTQGKFI